MESILGIGRALRALRKMKGLTQEDFSDVSSRTYISSVERGLKSPTMEKINEFAGALTVHPASVVVLAYCNENLSDADDILALIKKDLTDARLHIVESV